MLELKDIHTYYGDSHILQGVSLKVEAGALVALVGRNGVGKTTLVHSIAGFTPPRQGQILFNGQDISSEPIEKIALSGIGIVPQGRRIFPSLSVHENLQVAARKAVKKGNRPRFKISDIYDLFPNLAARKKNGGNELSGGEQQMLAIARALVGDPKLILLDEPTEGLAPLLVREIAKTIKEIQTTGLPVLLVEQSLDMVSELSSYIYVMSKGQIVYSSTTAEFESRTDIKKQYLGVSQEVSAAS